MLHVLPWLSDALWRTIAAFSLLVSGEKWCQAIRGIWFRFCPNVGRIMHLWPPAAKTCNLKQKKTLHRETQLQTVPVLPSLYSSLISLSSFTFPGAHCQIFLLFLPLASLSFLACCHHTNNKTSSQSADIYYSAIFPTLPPLSWFSEDCKFWWSKGPYNI